MLDLDSLVGVLVAIKLVLQVRDLLRKGRSPRRRGDADSVR
jgi:hypothetical protein